MVPLGQRHTKYLKDNPAAQHKRNRLRALCASIAGVPQNGFCKLPPDRKEVVRRQAQFMYDLGHQVSHIEIAEEAVRAGFVYVITNPTWPDHVKIGRAFDCESRLSNYQTGCPYREYEMSHSVYFDDCLSAEKNIHAGLSCLNETGEWYRMTARQALEVINQYKEAFPCGANS